MPGDDPGPSQKIDGDGNTQVGRDQINIRVQAPTPPKAATPVHIQRVIRKLDEIIDSPQRPEGPFARPAEVDRKLKYNAVDKYAPFIREYGAYGHAVEEAYTAVDNASPPVRPRVTRFLRSLYNALACSGRSLSSDEILAELSATLKSRLADVDLPAEEVEPCCDMLIAHAFIECTVLKNPAAPTDHADR